MTLATDGWFTADPQRAALLRAAILLHLPIVAFDVDEADLAWMQAHPDESGEYRERRLRVVRPQGRLSPALGAPSGRVIGERPLTLHARRCQIDLPLT